MKTSLISKYSLITICIVSLLTSLSFLDILRTPPFQRLPAGPMQSPPNPQRGPEIDKVRFKVIEGGSGPPPPPPPPPPNETLYVNEFTADFVDWTTYGVSPYLNATGDGNYIEATTDGAMMAWFGFENVTPGATIAKVVLEGYTDGPYSEGVDYDVYNQSFTWLGSLYATGGPAWVTPRWVDDQTLDELDPTVLTEEGLNSLRVLVYFYDPGGSGGAGNIIDAMRLKVWYQEWPEPPEWEHGVQIVALQTHETDVLTDLMGAQDVEKLASECFTITSTPGFHIAYIGFNVRPDQRYKTQAGSPIAGPVLGDANFRHACFHCYNQEEILASIYKYVVTPIQSLVPPAQGGWVNQAVQTHPYNPGDPLGTTVYDPVTKANADACSILRYGGYTYDSGEDNWLTPYDLDGDTVLNDYIPTLLVFTPTYEVAPTSAEHGARFAEDCNAIGIPLEHDPREYASYLDLVYGTTGVPGGEFDLYMHSHELGRFPDHLYNFCHSSQDTLIRPGAYNGVGVNCSELDAAVETVKFSLNHAEKLDAAHDAQAMLYDPDTYPECGCAYMNMYSRIYFDAFNPGLRGIVNSPGFGSDNMWTFLNIHWEPGHPYERLEDGNSTIIWCLGEEPELLNPCYAYTSYAWEILDRILDSLKAVNPYTHADIPWITTDWNIEGPITETVTLDSENRLLGLPAGATVDVIDGMKCTYTIRTDVTWHCGNLYTVDDAEWNLEFFRNNEIPRYMDMWENLIDVQVINSTSFVVYNNETSQFLPYDFMDAAAYLPPPVWAPLDGKPLPEILAYDPASNTTKPTGAGPRFGTDACPTQLYGTGAFVFQYYDPVGMYADMTANRYYFKSTEEIQTQKVEMFWACGDVNRDGVVDQIDQARLNASFGCVIGEPCYDPDCDFNSDGIVNGYDGMKISFYWGDRREYPAEVIDVAILEATASPASVLPGHEVNITIVAKNKGNAGFTTNFTYYYNNTFIENQTVADLLPCHNTSIHYIWDTIGIPPGVYIISVNATVIDGADANLTDNTFTDGTVTIGPRIAVDPDKSMVGSAGKDFSINITITNAPYNTTWAWEFKLSWDKTLLNITDIREGLFLNESGTWATTFVNLTNQENGWVLASCTLTEDPIEHGQPLPHGNGTLATLNFTVLDVGNCALHLSDTLLLNYTIDAYTHTTQDGEFEVVLGDINRDGVVDDADMEVVTMAYGATPGDPNWNPEADIWGPDDEPDGYINIYDLAILGKSYG